MARNLSQGNLGKDLGLTFQQVQKYERGLNRISAGRLFEASVVLKIEIGYFFEGLDKCSPAAPVVADEASTLFATFSGIPSPRLRKVVLALISTLASDEPIRHESGVTRRRKKEPR